MENFPHLPTLLSVGAAVIFLMLVLNQFLFKPLRRIIDERERRTKEARGELDEAGAVQAQRLDEIAADLEVARKDLEAEAERLSQMIAEQVLGRPVGSDGADR